MSTLTNYHINPFFQSLLNFKCTMQQGESVKIIKLLGGKKMLEASEKILYYSSSKNEIS